MHKLLLSVLACGALATPAFANGATTVPQFDAAIAAARLATSPGGTQVTRGELRGAISFFLSDDGVIDSVERSHLTGRLASAAFLTGVTSQARKYATDFVELNDGGPTAPLSVADTQVPITTLVGATGRFTSVAWSQEGFLPSGAGVTNQITVQTAYRDAFNADPRTFDPINLRELVEALSRPVDGGAPIQDEIDGAVALLTQISRNSNRLYLGSWITNGRGGGPGDLGGYVIAAVSTDRRFVRFLEVRTFTE
jgi:hypothetical protein